MMGVPTYQPLAALNFSLPRDDRAHAVRLRGFFIRACATARSATPQVGRLAAFLAKNFRAETPTFAMAVLHDSFDLHPMEAFQAANHGSHGFGDASKLMSASVTFVSYADIMAGCLFSLTFFQYLAPGSILACVQHGASGMIVPAGFEVLARHFSAPQDVPTVTFMRVDRQWQSQVQA